MDSNSNFAEIIRNSLDSVKEIAGVDTIIGEPISTPSGVSIIPVSKVSMGFASGGLDYEKAAENAAEEEKSTASKKAAKQPRRFGGGGGTGISVTPIGFLVINPDGQVSMINVGAPEGSNNNVVDSLTSLLEKSPFIVSKLKNIFDKGDKKDEPQTEETAESPAEQA